MSLDTSFWIQPSPSSWSLVSQGAEGIVYSGKIHDRLCIIKQRLQKKYRHPTLDEKINVKRVKEESKMMNRMKQSGISVPSIYFVDIIHYSIIMEYVHGITMKAFLDMNEDVLLRVQSSQANENEKNLYEWVSKSISEIISKIHDIGIIHGDLTTSNIMKRESKDEIVMIDFGLSYSSQMVEDKAVDLYVLERAFLSTHPSLSDMFKHILELYRIHNSKGTEILNRLEDVRMRGRKKVAFG